MTVIETVAIDINAILRLESLEESEQSIRDTAARLGMGFAREFWNSFPDIASEQMSAAGPKVQALGDAIASMMRAQPDLSFADAFEKAFQRMVQAGKLANDEFTELNNVFGRMQQSVQNQLNEALALAEERIGAVKNITSGYRTELMLQIQALRLGSKTTAEFNTGVERLIKGEIKLKEESKKKTAAVKGQNKALSLTKRVLQSVSRSISQYVKRLAVLFVGITAIRRAFTSINRLVKESIDLYLEAAGALNPINMRLAELEQRSRASKIALGQTLAVYKLLMEELNNVALELLVTKILPLMIEGLTRAARAIIILTGVQKAWLLILVLIPSTIFGVWVKAFDVMVSKIREVLAAIDPIAKFLPGPLRDAFIAARGEVDQFGEELGQVADIAVQFARGVKDEIGNALTNAAKSLEAFNELMAGLKGLAPDVEEFQAFVDNIKKAIDGILDETERSIEKAALRLERKMSDITTRFSRKRTDMERDLQRDLADINRSAQADAVMATVDFQIKKFRMQEDHLIAMRDLEESFLFDLEDAVRERDARGVLLAQRRFNMEKKKLLEQKGLREKRLKEDFKRELVEIKREQQIRRAERLFEFELASADVTEQEQRARDDAQLAFNRQVMDIRKAQDRKLEALAEGLQAELNLNAEQLEILTQLYAAKYGPGGEFEQLVNHWAQVQATATAPDLSPFAGTGQTSVQSINAFTEGQVSSPFDAVGQKGGTLFATSPTSLLVGEASPERVDITPLSEATGAPRAGFGGGSGGEGEGKVEVEVMMGEGLVGEVIDEAMGEVANVMVRVNNADKEAR